MDIFYKQCFIEMVMDSIVLEMPPKGSSEGKQRPESNTILSRSNHELKVENVCNRLEQECCLPAVVKSVCTSSRHLAMHRVIQHIRHHQQGEHAQNQSLVSFDDIH
jgi:hypothetical protein